jgi:hypothetical protein
LKRRFEELGFETDLRLPDEQDALGRVLDVIRDGALVQIVNYANPFRATTRAAHDAIANAELVIDGLRIAPLPELVALKLYAGGRKSENDVIELLHRNPEQLETIRNACVRHGFGDALESLIRDAAIS